MSVIFDGELTSLFNQDEVSGPMQDSLVAAKHWTGIFNSPTFNGDSVTYDGINQWTQSDVKSNGVFIDTLGDYTMYMHMKILSPVGAVNERWIRPTTLSGTRQGPLISPLFSATLGEVFVNAHVAGGCAFFSLSMGRDFNADEEAIIAISYDFSAKTLNGVLRSLDGLDLSDTNTGTTNPGFGATDRYQLFNNTVGGFSHVELLEMGSIDGTVKSLSELESSLNTWVASRSTTKSPIVPKVLDTIYPSNGIMNRDLFKSP